MGKGKKSSGKSYVSKGERKNVSSHTLNGVKTGYLQSGERVMNQLKAFRKGKRVVVRVANPEAETTGKPYLYVDAKTVWKNPQGLGYVAN